MRLVGEHVEERRVVADAAPRIVDARGIDGAVLEADHLGRDLGRLLRRAELLVARIRQPFVERKLDPREAVLVGIFAGDARMLHRCLHARIAVVREEVERRMRALHGGEERLDALHVVDGLVARVARGRVVEPAAPEAADLLLREARLQVRGRRDIEADELLERPLPHLVELLLGMEVGLVPDFPVRDLHARPVGPALHVMRHHVLADARPLRVVLRREDAVGPPGGAVLDRHAEAEVRPHAGLVELDHQVVREREVVALRVVFVRVEVAEDVRDVHVDVLAERPARVVQTRKRDARLGEIMEQAIVPESQHRRLPHAVHRLDGAGRGGEVHLHLGGERTRGAYRRTDANHDSFHFSWPFAVYYTYNQADEQVEILKWSCRGLRQL